MNNKETVMTLSQSPLFLEVNFGYFPRGEGL